MSGGVQAWRIQATWEQVAYNTHGEPYPSTYATGATIIEGTRDHARTTAARLADTLQDGHPDGHIFNLEVVARRMELFTGDIGQRTGTAAYVGPDGRPVGFALRAGERVLAPGAEQAASVADLKAMFAQYDPNPKRHQGAHQ